MFVFGFFIGYLIGSFITLALHCCLIISKDDKSE